MTGFPYQRMTKEQLANSGLSTRSGKLLGFRWQFLGVSQGWGPMKNHWNFSLCNRHLWSGSFCRVHLVLRRAFHQAIVLEVVDIQ